MTVIRGIFDIDAEVYGLLGYVPMECKQYSDYKINEIKESENNDGQT